jgi:hypothetical protein
MEKNELTKEEFWTATDEIFGEGFFDNENVTTEEIKNQFFKSLANNMKLKLNPAYGYWLHRTVFDMFERSGSEVTVNDPIRVN